MTSASDTILASSTITESNWHIDFSSEFECKLNAALTKIWAYCIYYVTSALSFSYFSVILSPYFLFRSGLNLLVPILRILYCLFKGLSLSKMRSHPFAVGETMSILSGGLTIFTSCLAMDMLASVI